MGDWESIISDKTAYKKVFLGCTTTAAGALRAVDGGTFQNLALGEDRLARLAQFTLLFKYWWGWEGQGSKDLGRCPKELTIS